MDIKNEKTCQSRILDTLLRSYKDSYDIKQPYCIGEDLYDAYAEFNVTSAKYVLVKKAELWRADCFEHTFFRVVNKFTVEDIVLFQSHVSEYIEPELVRGGEKWPPQNHMYTYITGVFICDEEVSAEAKHVIKKFRFLKNYKFTIRGYSETRIVVFDTKNQEIFGNRAAKELVKGYTKSGIILAS